MWYNQRFTFSGNVWEYKFYACSRPYGYSVDRPKMHYRKQKKGGAFLRTASNSLRSQKKVRRLINSNFSCLPRNDAPGRESVKFLTLTYARNMQSQDRAVSDFAEFVDRLGRFFGHRISYVSVPELQERGAIHWHTVLRSPYLPDTELTRLWSKHNDRGSWKLREVEEATDTGRYISKYISQDAICVGRFHKAYLHSRDLRDQTEEYCMNRELEGFEDEILRENSLGAFEFRYTGEYTGDVFGVSGILPPLAAREVYERVKQQYCELVAR